MAPFVTGPPKFSVLQTVSSPVASLLLAVVAHLKVEPQNAAKFEKVFAAVTETVFAEEPGCLVYQLAKDPKSKTPGDYTVIELYKDATALEVVRD